MAPSAPQPSRETGQLTSDGRPILADISAPDFRPSTRTEQLKVQLYRDGPSLQTAIDLFDLTLANLPGASEYSLPPGDGVSVTFALALINSYRADLSPEQLHIVDSFTVGVPAAGSTAQANSSAWIL